MTPPPLASQHPSLPCEDLHGQLGFIALNQYFPTARCSLLRHPPLDVADLLLRILAGPLSVLRLRRPSVH